MKLIEMELEASLLFLKVLGGFPYIKERRRNVIFVANVEDGKASTQEDGRTTDDHQRPLPYKKNLALLVGMPIVVSFIYILFTYLSIWSHLETNPDTLTRGGTYLIADIMEDIINLTANVLLGIYIMLNTSSAIKVVLSFDSLVKRIHSKLTNTSFDHIKFILVLLLFSISNLIIIVYTIFKVMSSASFFASNELFEVFFNTAIHRVDQRNR